jgi:hypothetical protein
VQNMRFLKMLPEATLRAKNLKKFLCSYLVDIYA